MQNLYQYLEQDEEIILSEKDEEVNVFYDFIYNFSFFVVVIICVMIIFDLSCGGLYSSSLYQKITDIMLLLCMFYIIFFHVKSFYTKIYLTNKNIIAEVFGKINKYPFENVCKIGITSLGNWAVLIIKNGQKYEKYLLKININNFKEKFLSLYPDYKEEKIKTSPLTTFFLIIFMLVLFLSATQAQITDKIGTKKLVNEYSKVIYEKNNYSWFQSIFSKFLYNIELQKSERPLKVIVGFVVDENSNLLKADIVQYSDNQNFNDKAIEAVQKLFPLDTEIPKTLKKYAPVKMRFNIVHNGTNHEDLRKNYTFWLEVFGPEQTKPYIQLYLK